MTLPLPSSLISSGDDDQLLADLIEEWTRQLQSGEAIDWAARLRDHPQYAEQLSELLPALQALAEVREKSSDGHSASGACQRPDDAPEMGCSDAPLVGLGVLGDYRLLREIGRGGMGVVYEAEQISLRRRVALKVLPFAAALDGRQLQRFKTEAQAAAQLHHNNIVPVYAVGYEQGVHYYAMQFIEGQTLAQAIRELRDQKENGGSKVEDRGLKIENRASKKDGSGAGAGQSGSTVDDQRTRTSIVDSRSSILNLAFFRTVANLGIQAADALEYAHQMGVIHRDIKPANLLIENYSVINHLSSLKVWITDFGLARCQTDTGFTGTGDVLGTLRYMSPEQAQGQHSLVDHRTDIYALGMSLYEVVTLRPAFSGQTREEVLAQLSTQEPIPLRRLNKSAPVELETIILKSLAKRPEERYSSAQEFADDLRRFLEDKPILARRPSLADKARKWARRHKRLMRAGFTMAGLAVVGLVLSIVTIARERQETEKRRRQARRAVDEMYSQFAESMLSRQPGMEQLEKQFLLKALHFYQEFVTENDSELRLETAKAWRRMGDIYYKLGQLDKAKEAFLGAADQLKLSSESSDNDEYQRESALTQNNLANVFRDEGRLVEAEQCYRQAQQELESLQALDDHDDLAGVQCNLGIVLANLGQLKEAEQTYRNALAILERLADQHPDAPGYRHDHCGCMNNLGNLLTAQGRFGEAEKLLNRAVAGREKSAADFPTFPAYRQGLTVSHTGLAALLAATDHYAESEKHYRDAGTILEKLMADFPATPGYKQALASNEAGLACLLMAIGRFDESEKSHRRALAMRESLSRDHPSAVSFQQEIAASHAYQGQLAFVTGRYSQAEAAFQQALTLRQKLAADNLAGVRHQRDLASSHHQLANVLARLGRLSQAESHFRQALIAPATEAAEALPALDCLELASWQSDFGALLMHMGRHDEAEGQLRSSLTTLRKISEEYAELPQIRLGICVDLNRLSSLYQNTNRNAEADKSLNLALALAEKLTAEAPSNPDVRRQRAHLRIRRAEWLAATGKISPAQEALSQGLTLLAKLADDYPAAPVFRQELARALDLLGCLLVKEGKKTEAVKTFVGARRLLEELTRNYPEAPEHFQELAWFLVTCPHESNRDAKLGEQLAERAVGLAPEDGDGWSALGVARYRIGDWQKAETALLQATRLQNGGGCAQWLFLAMDYQQLGDHTQARRWFEKANLWMNKNQPVNEDITRFRAEAEKVMGRPSADLLGGTESP